MSIICSILLPLASTPDDGNRTEVELGEIFDESPPSSHVETSSEVVSGNNLVVLITVSSTTMSSSASGVIIVSGVVFSSIVGVVD